MKWCSFCIGLAALARSAAGESCALPDGAEDFSVVTTGDATIGAHNFYTGIAIAGTLTDGSPGQSATVDSTKSYIKTIVGPTINASPNKPYDDWNFNGGLVEGATSIPANMRSRFVYLARNAISGEDQNGNKVVVLSSGGSYTTETFRGPDGQSNDNRKTLVIFNTADDITLTKTGGDRDFGPTVIAPFSKVIIQNAGSIDGSVYAKTIESTEGGLQMHGRTYSGPINCTESGAWGDPHFRLWTGEIYDFQGVCDLVLLDAPSLSYGPMKIHVRTTQIEDWSYIESAAIQLNGDVMEVGGWGSLIINGVHENDMRSLYDLPETFGGFPFKIVRADKVNHEFHVEFGPNHHVKIKSFRKYVGVFFHLGTTELQGSRGLLGSTETGDMLGRDGATVFTDTDEFGQNWQVLPSEPKLFDAQREPQLPHAKCVMPVPAASQSRRLGKTIARTAAERACANWGMNKAACVHDVMKTGDLQLAEAANFF